MMDVKCYNVYCRCMLFPRDAPDVKGKSRLVNYYSQSGPNLRVVLVLRPGTYQLGQCYHGKRDSK